LHARHTYKNGNTMQMLKHAATAAALLALGSTASAAVVQYTDLASFNAATVNNIVEANSAPAGSYTPIGNSTVNGITYDSYAYMVDPAMEPSTYGWNTGPVLLQSWSSTLTFAPTTAFAALFGSFRPYAADMIVEIAGVQHSISTASHPDLTFYGWTSSTPFSSVTFWNNINAYAILDDVTRADAIPGAQIPEPGTLALLGLALLALGFCVRARRR
jgi:hypothetical protein